MKSVERAVTKVRATRLDEDGMPVGEPVEFDDVVVRWWVEPFAEAMGGGRAQELLEVIRPLSLRVMDMTFDLLALLSVISGWSTDPETVAGFAVECCGVAESDVWRVNGPIVQLKNWRKIDVRDHGYPDLWG